MENGDEIKRRMAACVAVVDHGLAEYRAARSEQIRCLAQLASSIDQLGSSTVLYRKKMERNSRRIARTTMLAHRLEEIVSGAP